MNSDKKMQRLALLPIFLILVVVPLICHYQVYRTNLENCDWQAADVIYGVDIFLLPKGFAICAVAVLMVILFLYFNYYKAGLLTETYPLLVYALLIGFSTLCSKYKYFGIHGGQDQFESIFVLLGYLIIAIYCMYSVNREAIIQKVLKFLLCGAAIVSIIGIFQMLKLDPMRSKLGQALILLGSGQTELTFNLPLGTVYATLFNPNYVGTYACLILPCAVAVGFATKKLAKRVFCIILSVALLIITFGAGAKNGLISLGISLLLIIIIYRRTLLKKLKWILISVATLLLIIVGVNAITDNTIGNTMQTLLVSLKTLQSPVERTVDDILTKDDEVEFVMKEDSLHIKYQVLDNDMMTFDLKDNEGTDISYEANGTKIRLLDDRFSMIEIEPCVIGETYSFTVYVDNMRWDFSNQVNDGTYYFLDWANKFVKLEKADSAVFTNCPKLFSGRGYIWAKTIPLLKKYFFLGAGPDSFQMVFPQYDYVDLAYKFSPNMLITRAHNMYLQIAVQTGVLSLICFLVFYGMYFVKSVKLYIKRKELLDDDPYLFHIGAGLFVASFGYMLSGIVNDSLPVTAPLYWAVIGIGIAVNSLISKKYPVIIKEKETELVWEDKVTETKTVQPTANKKKKQSRKQRKQQS